MKKMKNHQCDECDKKFRKKSQMELHVKAVHKKIRVDDAIVTIKLLLVKLFTQRLGPVTDFHPVRNRADVILCV